MSINTIAPIANITPIAYDANGVEIYARADGDKHYHRPDLHVEAMKKITLPTNGGFKFAVIDMGRVIGVDHLVKTTEEDTIISIRRGNRPGFSRMVLNRTPEETQLVTAILCRNTDPEDPDFLPGTEGKWVLATLFEGNPGEKEPWDRAFKNGKNPEGYWKSVKFWMTNALVATPIEALAIEMMKIMRRRAARYLRNANMLPERIEQTSTEILIEYQGGYFERIYFSGTPESGEIRIEEEGKDIGGWNVENGEILW